MSNSEEKSPHESGDHIFVEPEPIMHEKKVRRVGGYPPTEVPHEEDETTRERQRRGVKSWLEKIVTETKKKELRDDIAYFVVDFRIRADHPSTDKLLKRLQSQLLTFLDEEKTKALVASKIDALDQTAKSRKDFPKYMTNMVFDIRPMRIDEQIDEKILSDETWITELKDVDVYVVPNIPIERVGKYVQLAIRFLRENETEIRGVLIDNFSNSGMLSVRTDFPTTSKLLEKSSFVYRIHATPEIRIQEMGTRNSRRTLTKTKVANNLVKRRNPTSNTSKLPEVCVIDTGINRIPPLATLISQTSSEPNMPDDNDHDDHGTSVAYLVAYGEGDSPRSRIISHKVLSGSIRSNLYMALANAIGQYLQRTRIFTCSINFVQDNEASRFETLRIDRLAQASNACILFSAGNILPNAIRSFTSRGLAYPRYLDDSPILHPSDATSVVAVGSYCKRSSPNSIAPIDSPSPFTRYDTRNPLMCDCVKPEIVEHGGNLNTNYSCNGVGVITFSANGSYVEKVGTSLSTPIVAGHLAEVYEKYGSMIRNAETLKAIAYSSCERTQNHPKFVGFGKPNCEDMLVSSFQSATIVFEGEMRLAHPHLKKKWLQAHKITVYVPVGVERIELCLVHSDNYSIPRFCRLCTYIDVIPEKPARESAPPPDQGHLKAREHVKKLVWRYVKGVKGFWTFTLIPRHIRIPFAFRENILLRYGGVVKLTTTRPRRTSLADEVRRNLKGTIRQ